MGPCVPPYAYPPYRLISDRESDANSLKWLAPGPDEYLYLALFEVSYAARYHIYINRKKLDGKMWLHRQ